MTDLSIESRLDIEKLMTLYGHLMDKGDPAWAKLFTKDGEFHGDWPKPFIGHEQLSALIPVLFEKNSGLSRHNMTNILVDAIDADHARVQAYCIVVMAESPPRLFVIAEYDNAVVKTEAGWRFEKVIATIRR